MTGKELRERREKLGLSRPQLSNLTSYSINFIYEVENGIRNMSKRSEGTISDALSKLEKKK